MRVLTQSELSRFTKAELFALLRRIASDLPDLKEGSAELRMRTSTCRHSQRPREARLSAALRRMSTVWLLVVDAALREDPELFRMKAEEPKIAMCAIANGLEIGKPYLFETSVRQIA